MQTIFFMASIDGLFEQIIHYEKTAQKRKNFLQELRQAVHSTREKGKALEKNYVELKKELAKKVGELSDKELMCKWLSCQETIFRQQQGDLEKQLEDLGEQQESVLKKLQVEKEEFCAKISQFMTQFGPRNSGSTEREQCYTSQLQYLLHEKEKLKSSIDKCDARKLMVNKLCTEKENLRAQVEKLHRENKKLTSSLCDELQKSTDLEEKEQFVTDIPTTDPEFKSIQEELEAERRVRVELEEQYSQVQSQLHQLHQKLWQQQLKQQKLKQQHPLKQQTFTKQQQVSQQQHSKQQHLQPCQSVAWQQRGNVQTAGGQRGQQAKTTQKVQKNQASATSHQTNSQENSETDSCLEEYSDVLFMDSDDPSVGNQESQEYIDDHSNGNSM